MAECPPRFAACPVKRVCMCVCGECVGGGGGGIEPDFEDCWLIVLCLFRGMYEAPIQPVSQPADHLGSTHR